ncbi:coat protein [Cassava Colombian symptomless virus]|uniref:Coat protein n=1 Tax=Cassava Colombian symptomless virus TaxID=2843917 RepID=V9PRM1_9VIRU|nr:coat protein [Cassava Colombian symptomless virus]AHA91822.1 coat protein [Cassava Colombian symptomless virus]
MEETRQPARPVTSNTAFNAGDMCSAPSLSDLDNVHHTSMNASIATSDQIKAIGALWVQLGVPQASLAFTAWDMARHCADIQATKTSTMIGISPYCGLARSLLAGTIKSVTTMRRFCSYYAKVVWNMLLKENKPPANWAKMGFLEETKFAAFDFFDAVLSPAALEPKGGLIREPTQLEITAYQTAKFVALNRAEVHRGNLTSNLAEVTRGQVGTKPTIQLLN